MLMSKVGNRPRWASRNETVQMLDAATGAVLATQSVSGFSGGQYLSFNASGNVTFRFTNVGSVNAVISGVWQAQR